MIERKDKEEEAVATAPCFVLIQLVHQKMVDACLRVAGNGLNCSFEMIEFDDVGGICGLLVRELVI